MVKSLPSLDELLSQDIPRGLFGYRIAVIDRIIKHLHAQDEQESRVFADEVQRLSLELSRLEERRSTLGELTNHLRIECERLELQLTQARINGRFAQEGVRQEIERLDQSHQQRLAVLDAAEKRTHLEAQSYEKNLWQLTENLTRVLQDSQVLANQQLASESTDSVWSQFSRIVLGDFAPAWPADPVTQGSLEHRRVPRDLVQVSTRSGDRLGYLEGVLLSLAPPAIVAYAVSPLGYIPAHDVQVLRLRHVTVQSHYTVLTEADLVHTYTISKPLARIAEDQETTLVSQPNTVAQEPDVQAPSIGPMVPEDIAGAPHTLESLPNQPDAAIPITEAPQEEVPPLNGGSSTETDTSMPPPMDYRDRNADPLKTVDSPAHEAPAPISPRPSSDWMTDVPVRDDQEMMTDIKSNEPPIEAPLPSHELPVGFMPSPSWVKESGETEPDRNNQLTLPGIEEEDSPVLGIAYSATSKPIEFEDDSLPGLSGGRPMIGSPSWADTDTIEPSVVMSAPSTAESEANAPEPPLSTEDTGALDVRTFLFGKHVGQDIRDAQNNLIVRNGEVITPEIVERVERAGFLPELIVHMVF